MLWPMHSTARFIATAFLQSHIIIPYALSCKKLNLEIIPQGTLSHISVEPTLIDQVVMAQLHDKGVGIIKQTLSEGEEKYKCFYLDHKGILWFDGRLVVHKNPELRNQILDEAHLSKFSIHPCSTKMYQDLRSNFWWT